MFDKAIVLSADAWEMLDEKTKKPVKGISVWYINDYRDDSETSFGLKPSKVTVPFDWLSSFRKGPLPALFEMGFSSRPLGKEAKASLVLVSMNFLKSVDLLDLFGASKTLSTVAKA